MFKRPPDRVQAPLCVGALTVLITASLASAQERALAERVEVQLVEVDVLATDRKGDPVTNLALEELQLYDDGRLVEVTHFLPPADITSAPVSGEAPEAIGTVGRPRRQRLAIFLDELHLTLRSKHLMFDQLSEFLRNDVSSDTEVLLAAFTGTVEVVLPFTNDRKKVAAALEERLLSGAATAVALDVDEASVLRLLKTALIEGLSGLAGAVPLFDMMDAACQSDVATVARGHSQQQYGRVAGVASAMQQFVASLGAYPGHKYLLYVSDGPPLIAGQVAWDHAIELCDGSLMGGDAGIGLDAELAGFPPARRFPGSAQIELNDFNTLPLWEAVAAEASSQRVTINALHAAGIESASSGQVDGAQLGPRSQQSARLSRQDTLRLLAEETGGETILNRNQIGTEVRRVAATDSSRYELAYLSSHLADGAIHALRLETTREDVTLGYRRSYQSKTAEQSLVDTMLASLYHDFESNPLDLRVQAKWVEAAAVRKGLGRVRLEISVPFGSLALLPEAEGRRGMFTVFVAAIDDRGVGTDVRKKTIPLMLGGDNGKRYDYVVELDLEKEHEHKIAVAVQDEIGATTSHVVRKVRAVRP